MTSGTSNTLVKHGDRISVLLEFGFDRLIAVSSVVSLLQRHASRGTRPYNAFVFIPMGFSFFRSTCLTCALTKSIVYDALWDGLLHAFRISGTIDHTPLSRAQLEPFAGLNVALRNGCFSTGTLIVPALHATYTEK